MAEQRAVDGNKVLLGTTPKGKEIYMVRKYNMTVRFIEFGSGGILPDMLRGGYSSIQLAQDSVDSFIAKLAAKQVDEEGNSLKKDKSKDTK